MDRATLFGPPCLRSWMPIWVSASWMYPCERPCVAASVRVFAPASYADLSSPRSWVRSAPRVFIATLTHTPGHHPLRGLPRDAGTHCEFRRVRILISFGPASCEHSLVAQRYSRYRSSAMARQPKALSPRARGDCCSAKAQRLSGRQPRAAR